MSQVNQQWFKSLLLSEVTKGLMSDAPEWRSFVGQGAGERHAVARQIRLCLLAKPQSDPIYRWFEGLSTPALAKLLQCLEFDYRVEEEPNREQITESTLAFVDRQSRVGRITPTFRIDDLAFMRSYIRSILGSKPEDLWYTRARHGSGAVAEGLVGLDKWLAGVHLPRQLQQQIDPLWRLNWLESTVRRSKVAFVPKDARGPRVIAMEPSGSMLFQEAAMDMMYERLCRKGFPLRDQWVHTRLMLRKESDVVTVDLKDASDFVSWKLVTQLFPKSWVKLFAELRTPFCELPNGATLRVHSAFLMGAALCFPVLTVVCAALCALSLKRSDAPRLMSVYGDDIIIHSGASGYLEFALSCAGLVLNHQKSGWGGAMLETCGFDMHGGFNIRPVFIRKCSTENMAELIESTMGLQRSFYERGFSATAERLAKLVDRLYTWNVYEKCPPSGKDAFLRIVVSKQVPRSEDLETGVMGGPSTVRRRWNTKNSCGEHLGLVVVEETRRTNLSGAGAFASALCNELGTMTPNVESCPSAPRVQLTWMATRPHVLPNKDVYHILGSGITL